MSSPHPLRLHIKLAIAAVFWLAIVAASTVGYKLIGGERSTWMDAFYMTIITVTTVGYGEIIDLSNNPAGRLFTTFVLLGGLGSLWYMFSVFTALLLESDLDKALRRRRMEKFIKRLHGHYIVCGFGRVGRNVARELESTNRHFVALDEDMAMLEAQKEKSPALLFLHGDASDDDMLVRADIADAHGVFAVTGDDSKNLMIALTAKQLNPNVRVVARCNELRNTEKLRKAGADAIVSPDFTGGMRIVSAMVRPHVVSFLEEMLRAEHRLRIEEVAVPRQFQPRRLGSLGLRSPDYVLLAVRKGSDWIFNPDEACVIEAGNTLIAMASPHGRQELEAALLPG